MPDIVQHLRSCGVDKDNFPNMGSERAHLKVKEALDAADEIERLRNRLETATDLLRNALNVIGVQNDWTVPYQEIRQFIDETDDAAPPP